MDLPDINVWLALTFEAHRHHVPARAWFDSLDEGSCAFCRVTQLGFLRLATNPTIFGPETLTLADAWDCYDQYAEDPRIEFVLEPLGLEHLLRRFTSGSEYSPKVWTDAYLAAFSVGGGARLVSFDGGFRQYEQLDCLVLTGP